MVAKNKEWLIFRSANKPRIEQKALRFSSILLLITSIFLLSIYIWKNSDKEYTSVQDGGMPTYQVVRIISYIIGLYIWLLTENYAINCITSGEECKLFGIWSASLLTMSNISGVIYIIYRAISSKLFKGI